jgi:hypothetical protein
MKFVCLFVDMLIQQPNGQRLRKHEYKDITNKETNVNKSEKEQARIWKQVGGKTIW